MVLHVMLKESMEEHGASIHDIVTATGRDISTVNKWLHGVLCPSRVLLETLGDYLEHDEEYFLKPDISYPPEVG